MPSVDLNWWAVLAGTAVTMVLGAMWYSPALFYKQWMKETGRKLEDMRGSNAGPGYAIAAIGAFLMAFVLGHLVAYVGADTMAEGVKLAFWVWLGFVATTAATNTIFAGRSRNLWAIDSGYFLVALLLNGWILAVVK